MSINIKQVEWKKTDTQETTNIFYNFNEKELEPGIEEVAKQDTTPNSDPEDPLPVHVIPNEG